MSNNIEISALLDTFMYLIEGRDIDGKSITSVISSMDTSKMSESQLKEYNVIKQNLDKIGDYKISNSSWNMTKIDGTPYNSGTVAATFSKGNDVVISYRGTSDGEWVDNKYCYAGADSPQQQEALDYFNNVANNYNNGEGLKNSQNVTVTGHSKGGNDAQYVMMSSENNAIIDNCVSMDGPGFSPEQVDEWKKKYGEEGYQRLIEKMYSVNGENDYVNPQGRKIILDDNTYYIPTPDADGFADYHEISYLFDKNGVLGKLDKNGQGELGAYAKTLSNIILQLPEEQRSECAMSIMSLCEMFMGSPKNVYKIEGINGEQITGEDALGLIVYGLPVILLSLASPEGIKVIGGFLESAIISYYNENGLWKTIGLGVAISLGTLIFAPILIKLGVAIYAICAIVESVINIIKVVGRVIEKVKRFLDKIHNEFVSAIKKLQDWMFKHSSGYKYATANPYIDINTTTMKQYAGQLRTLSSRSKKLDSKMNSLYWNLGIEWDTIANLGKLLKAEVILDFAYRLDACASYLETTATDFDNVEGSLLNI